MRNIYEEKKINWEIQQGVIINNCIAEDYPDCDVAGIIITPRCDIENKKVNTVHYLPIIAFENWLSFDFLKEFQTKTYKDLRGKLKNTLNRHGLSETFLDKQISKKDILKVAKLNMLTKDYERFEKELNAFYLLEAEDELKKMCVNNKLNKTIIEEIIQGKSSDFYLIEDWDDKKKFQIVLLRDIKRIQFSLLGKLSEGVFEKDLNEIDFIKSDLKKKNEEDNIYYIEAKMKSPFIEHLIQSFFHNFGRIGIDNFNKATNNILIESIDQIYK